MKPQILLLILLGFQLVSCDSAEPGEFASDFEVLWEETASWYMHFEFKGIDWDEVRTRYEPLAQQAPGGDIDHVLNDMLAELRDPHVTLTSGGDTWAPYISHRARRDEDAFDRDLVRKRLADRKTAGDGSVDYGRLDGGSDGGLGYIYFDRFTEESQEGFLEALVFLRGTDGLIIDVRNNQGGSLEVLIYIAGLFTTETFGGLPIYVLGERFPSPPVAPTGPFQYLQLVVLLIDGTSISAAESFSVVMKQIPHVTAMGDTTAGGGGGFWDDAPGIIRMPSGREAAVPTSDLRHYDDTPVELSGVAPDVRLVQSSSDADSGIDRQLDAAISFLSSR